MGQILNWFKLAFLPQAEGKQLVEVIHHKGLGRQVHSLCDTSFSQETTEYSSTSWSRVEVGLISGYILLQVATEGYRAQLPITHTEESVHGVQMIHLAT